MCQAHCGLMDLHPTDRRSLLGTIICRLPPSRHLPSMRCGLTRSSTHLTSPSRSKQSSSKYPLGSGHQLAPKMAGATGPAMKGNAVIRQSIFCDVCGAQRREANHWFVAYEEAGELRISSWASRRLLSAGTKHVCGERCTHKLMSEFLACAATAGSAQLAARAGFNDWGYPAHSGDPSMQHRPAQILTLPRLAYSPSHANADDQHRGTGRRTS